MYNAKNYIVLCVVMSFLLVHIGQYRHYVYEALADEKAAHMLLSSDVCTDTNLRVNLRQFDKCHEAERLISVGPYQRALFKVGEDVHICGHGRCKILYVDVTDRLTPLVLVVLVVGACVAVKIYTRIMHENYKCDMQCFVLPTNGAPRIKYE